MEASTIPKPILSGVLLCRGVVYRTDVVLPLDRTGYHVAAVNLAPSICELTNRRENALARFLEATKSVAICVPTYVYW